VRYRCLLQKRTGNNKKLRIVPVVEIYSISKPELHRYQSLGVNFTNITKALRVQGIQNCLLIEPFLDDKWFKYAMLIYEDGRNTTTEGILELCDLMDERTNKEESSAIGVICPQ